MNFSEIAQEAVTERKAKQKPAELAAMLQLLERIHLRDILEIGGMHGGTLWAWDQVAIPGKRVVVDLQVLEGRMEHFDRPFSYVVGDSTDPRTCSRVANLTPDGLFDFIFIDGDHRYSAVCKDHQNWSTLVRPGGIVAYHDIWHRRMLDHDMRRFWRTITVGRCAYEIYDPSKAWGGIGIITDRPLVSPLPPHCNPAGSVECPDQSLPTFCGECKAELEPEEEIKCRRCASCP